MRCPICNGNDWKNIDEHRISKQGMSVCTGCGFVSYPNKYQTKEQIKAHYRKDYRPAPTNHNMFSGERKLWYHEVFLRNLIEEWKKSGVKPRIGEVGAAMGMFLAWMKEQIDCELIHGTEWTTSFRRVAFHEFGIKLDEDFNFNDKYDLIVSFHVLEHQMDPDSELKAYRDCLTPSGLIYLSTPVWFREATNFGQSGFDLEYYWAPDHINCWSEEHLEHIFAKVGLEPVFKNTNVYGNTYLLKKVDPQVKEITWTAEKSESIAEKMKKCWMLLQQNETALAIETYPNCPSAWVNHFEMHRAEFNKRPDELEKFLNQGIAACPNTADTLTLAGDIMSRYEKYENSFEIYTKALERKPNNPTILMAMSNCFRQMALREKDPEKKIELFKKALSILYRVKSTSVELANMATSWIYHDVANIPMEGE